MAYDRYSIEYHLTFKGWVRGTETSFGKVEKEVEPPPDRVETWRLDVVQSSEWSPEDEEWTRLCASDSIGREAIESLHKAFPRPRRFSGDLPPGVTVIPEER